MRRLIQMVVPVAALVMLAGCAAYSWKSTVPQNLRKIAVPTFRNESNVTELGAITSRQILREVQREGTFKVASVADADLEVQGTICSNNARISAYDLHTNARLKEFDFSIVAEVSVIDKTQGKVLFENRKYKARTSFLAGQDKMTGMRDASGRVAEDLAQQIVEDLLTYQWEQE